MSLIPFPCLPVLATFLLLVFTLLVSRKMASKQLNSTPKMPPGPWKLPLVGNMFHLRRSQPHRSLRDLAEKYGPIMHLRLGEVSTVVVSSPEVAREVLQAHDICFADRPPLLMARIITYDSKNIGFSPYGDYWRQLRRICSQELLSPRRVQLFRSIREEEVSGLVEQIRLSAGSAFNLSEKLFALTYAMTARAAFGEKIRGRDQEAFISFVEGTTKLAGMSNVADMYPTFDLLHVIVGVKGKLEKLHRIADTVLEPIINQHRERRLQRGVSKIGDDLIDVLLEQEGVHFTNDNIKAVVLDMFGAGSETTATTVEWAMSEMLKNPSVMEKAQAEVRKVFQGKANVDETGFHELKYLKLVIKETLRLHPTVPLLLPRECRESCVIYGYEIPLKTRLIVNAWAIGRNPKYWVDAARFWPERFLESELEFKGADFKYIPFGAGRRMCPGIAFAVASMELQLAQLLFHFDWKLPNAAKSEDLDMTESFGMTVRRKWDLNLVPILHVSFLP